jgi:hypothetical protein
VIIYMPPGYGCGKIRFNAHTSSLGYDPLLDTEPELARTMASSVKQRIAFGERAGQKVRRIGSGFGYERAAELPSAHAVAEERRTS